MYFALEEQQGSWRINMCVGNFFCFVFCLKLEIKFILAALVDDFGHY